MSSKMLKLLKVLMNLILPLIWKVPILALRLRSTLRPPNGVKHSALQLETNIALNLAATSLRMEAPIPGKGG